MQKLTNASNAVAWSTTEQPFGETVSSTGSPASKLRFPGQYADAESGLRYNYFRDYDPTLGRYLQPDPIGQNGGLNLYGYANQNPVRYTDPLGLYCTIRNDTFGNSVGPGCRYNGPMLVGGGGAIAGGLTILNNKKKEGTAPDSPADDAKEEANKENGKEKKGKGNAGSCPSPEDIEGKTQEEIDDMMGEKGWEKKPIKRWRNPLV